MSKEITLEMIYKNQEIILDRLDKIEKAKAKIYKLTGEIYDSGCITKINLAKADGDDTYTTYEDAKDSLVYILNYNRITREINYDEYITFTYK